MFEVEPEIVRDNCVLYPKKPATEERADQRFIALANELREIKQIMADLQNKTNRVIIAINQLESRGLLKVEK